MKNIFLTEMSFGGKIPRTHINCRTEMAWMCALDADHQCIEEYKNISGYDNVFIIFPKGDTFLNAVGVKLTPGTNRYSNLLSQPIVETLKKSNKKVYSVQEGPAWFFNEWELNDQFNYINQLIECDGIFAHNDCDVRFYKGIVGLNKLVTLIPTLLIEELIQSIVPITDNTRAMIGGNFSNWYGGFQSYLVAEEFGVDKYIQTSHASRVGENQIPDLKVLPRMLWIDWMRELSTFKYAVHLMPTVAAGTFSLNCAYFGIPCIGNVKVNTQRNCFPDLSVEVTDVIGARELAAKLKNDVGFYAYCSETAKKNYRLLYAEEVWTKHMNLMLTK